MIIKSCFPKNKKEKTFVHIKQYNMFNVQSMTMISSFDEKYQLWLNPYSLWRSQRHLIKRIGIFFSSFDIEFLSSSTTFSANLTSFCQIDLFYSALKVNVKQYLFKVYSQPSKNFSFVVTRFSKNIFNSQLLIFIP